MVQAGAARDLDSAIAPPGRGLPPAGRSVAARAGRRRAAALNGSVIGRSTRFGFVYTLPALILFAVFIAYPIVANIVASFSGPHGVSTHFYAQAASDPVFWVAVKNSVLWVILCVIGEIAIGFALGVLIELYIPRGQALFRTLLFLPMVITPSVIALVFTTIYAPDYGLLFGLFNSLGLADSFPAILGQTNTAAVGIVVVNIWQWCGFFVLLYCVGIAQIDRELLDAAAIDGASGLTRLRHIIWPLLRSTHVSLVVLGTIQALQQFPLIYLMTEGGPANATQTLATYIFQTGFVDNQMAYASAVAVVLFALAMIFVAVEYALTGTVRLPRLRRREVPANG
jgi:raffinose/stachyose/melibiose transport system permease protein